MIEPRFFVWRQFRLQGRGNFLREISLNCKHVGQIAIVIFRPNVLVVIRVDQLHVHSDAITNPPDTAFQQRGYAECFADFARVARRHRHDMTSLTYAR